MSDTPITDKAYSHGLTYELVVTLKQLERELNKLKTERLKLHESLAKAQLASVPLCIGRPIIDILAKEGQWISESGQGVVAADDLFRNSPYDALDEAKANADALADALINIEEYWNRDQNETAMADACWHAVNLAQSALETYRNKYPQ